jgi:Putative zincin peptidase
MAARYISVKIMIMQSSKRNKQNHLMKTIDSSDQKSQPQPLPRFGALPSLPADHHLVYRLDLESLNILIGLNMGAVLLLLLGLFGFDWLGRTLPLAGFDPLADIGSIGGVLALLVGAVIMLIIHELFHGLGFMVFGAKPRYGLALNKGVAYAAADNYYLTRNAYLVVAMLPLVGITSLCILAMATSHGQWRTFWGIIGALNLSGAVGDLWFFWECLKRSPQALVRDFGEGAEIFDKGVE